MFGLIENLRQKSEGYRKGVAFGTSLVVSLMIFGVWVTVLFPNVVTPSSGSSGKISKSDVVQSPGDTDSDFKKNLAQSLGVVKLQWGSIKEYFKTTTYESDATLEVAVPERNQAAVEAQNRATQSHGSATGEESSVVY